MCLLCAWLFLVCLQISVDCPPGTTYGQYFHSLLLGRGLLLLGVHKLVEQEGLSFRATITNPHFVSPMYATTADSSGWQLSGSRQPPCR